MGYKVGNGCAEGAYMSSGDRHLEFVCDRANYNPWDIPDQLLPVADVLMKSEPFPNSVPILDHAGAFVGLRE